MFSRIPSIAIILATIAIAARRSSATRIEFEPRELSFGTLTKNIGKDPLLKVRLRNATSKAVEIRRVATGCGCVDASLVGSSTIPPHGHSEVEVRLRLLDVKAGEGKYALTVFDDLGIAGATPITYRFKPNVSAPTRELVFSDAAKPAGQKSTIRLQIDDSRFYGSLCATTSSPTIQATLVPGSDPAVCELVVTVQPDRVVGPIEESVTVSSINPSEPQLVLPVRGVIPLPVIARPNVILLAERPTSEHIVRQVILESASEYRVVAIQSSSKLVEVRPQKRGTTVSGIEIIVKPAAASKDGFIEEHVSLIFDRPRSFEITIPIVGEAR